jgi:hypothetical protein
MDFFFYCRDRPGAGEVREKTVPAHWNYMDRFDDRVIARGPTLTDDGSTSTGSMRMISFTDRVVADRFVREEPFAAAGVYREIIVRRWNNALGGTMHDYESDRGEPLFLMFAAGKPGMTATRHGLLEDHRAYFRDNGYLERFVFRGPLLSDDGEEWLGSAMAIELPDRAAVEAMLADEPYVRGGLYDAIEIHRWRFGGRQ